MNQVSLGKSGLRVSELCFGTLTLGRLQLNMPVAEGATAIAAGLELGVNFIDTAQAYGTYPHVAEALRRFAGPRPVIGSKSHARTADEMARAVDEALSALGIEEIGVFYLHNVRSAADLIERSPVLDLLVHRREAGVIRAIGASAHSVAGVRAALARDEIEVLMPVVNQRGFGLAEGGNDELLPMLHQARARGIFICAMKPLGGGHLYADAARALAWLRRSGAVDAIAVGMQAPAEVEMDVCIFNGAPVPAAVQARVRARPKRIIIYDICKGCGTCERACPQEAIHVVDGKARITQDKCLLCGYCAADCPAFAIRVV